MSRIFLRLNAEQNISKATNYEFISNVPSKVSICPIPEFIGEVKCDCGEFATVILNDEIYKCNVCIKLLVPESKLSKSNAISYPITKKTIKELKFEFSFNDEKWYTLWGRNIETNNWDTFLRDVKDMALNNREIEIEAEYIKEEEKNRKRLVIS